MRTRKSTLALITLGLATVAACNDGSPFEPEPTFADAEVVADIVIDVAALDRNDGDAPLFDELAEEIPGFAGFWFDRGCNLHVILTDLGQTEKAKEVLTPYLERYLENEPRCPRNANVVVSKGEFSWTQLSGWLDKMREAAALPGVSRFGIAIKKNRIVAAVDGRPTASKVLEIAEDNDVPTKAIMFGLAGGRGHEDRARDPRSRERNPRRDTTRTRG